MATQRRLISATTGVSAAWLVRIVATEFNAYLKLHRITRALAAPAGVDGPGSRTLAATAPGKAPVPATAGLTNELAEIEKAAQGCAVFHRRTLNPPAVEVCLDGHVWVITPDPEGSGWLARCRDVELQHDPVDSLWLPRSQGESTVPTLAWARLLFGAPLRSWTPDTSSPPRGSDVGRDDCLTRCRTPPAPRRCAND